MIDDDVAALRDQRIIDAHHHYWDLSLKAHPWLCEQPPIPFRYGNYTALRQDFLPSDYDRVSSTHRVVATVTMEGEWDEQDPVGESRWIERLRDEHGRPAAHVARAFLDRDDAEAVIATHANFDFIKGIRHKPTAAGSPGQIDHGAAGSMSNAAWRRGYAALAKHNLHSELQAPWWHVTELIDLIAAHPETPVVINHAFLPVDRSEAGLAAWRDALAQAARCENVTLKISGIGIKGRTWTYADQEPIIRACIDTFGPSRCMFASNFPVDRLCGSFATIFDGFKRASLAYTAGEREALFLATAARVYRLEASVPD